MKSILVTGVSGQLGKTFEKLSEDSSHQWFFTDKKALDVTQKKQIHTFLDKNPVDIILNTSAYTKVDKAEKEKDKAFAVNEKGVRNLAEISTEKSIFLIHFSTDYVFDGNGNQPYKTTDKPSPINTYGKSKLAGEEAIRSLLTEYLMIRTSWLYTEEGDNFVTKIKRLSQEQKELKIVSDQIGSPTYGTDLANFILYLLEDWDKRKKLGIYHFANKGFCSWYDFAKEILFLEGSTCKLIPCKTTDFTTSAKRPSYSVLDTSELEKDFSYTIPEWRDGLNRCFSSQK